MRKGIKKGYKNILRRKNKKIWEEKVKMVNIILEYEREGLYVNNRM